MTRSPIEGSLIEPEAGDLVSICDNNGQLSLTDPRRVAAAEVLPARIPVGMGGRQASKASAGPWLAGPRRDSRVSALLAPRRLYRRCGRQIRRPTLCHHPDVRNSQTIDWNKDRRCP
jgi:hypothetical protein